METDKNIWFRIINKAKENILIRIDGAIRSFSWDEFNSMFIMHPQEKNLAKLRELQKQNIVNDINDVIAKSITLTSLNHTNSDKSETPQQLLLSVYLTELEHKMKCSRQEVKNLIKQRMNQILDNDTPAKN